MPPKPPRPRSWLSLTLLSLTLLTGCNQPTAVGATYCPAAIHADAATKAWLNARPMPPSTLHYFNQLANQQALFDRGCK